MSRVALTSAAFRYPGQPEPAISDVTLRVAAGEVVALTQLDGPEFARGLVNYDADELRRIRGAKTADIERALGYKGLDEVVHRDNLVIL